MQVFHKGDGSASNIVSVTRSDSHCPVHWTTEICVSGGVVTEHIYSQVVWACRGVVAGRLAEGGGCSIGVSRRRVSQSCLSWDSRTTAMYGSMDCGGLRGGVGVQCVCTCVHAHHCHACNGSERCARGLYEQR